MTRRALILGLGDSGLAIARWLARQGWRLRVADTRDAPPQLQALRASHPDAQFVGGDFSKGLLDDIELVVISPGLAPTHDAVAPLLKAAKSRGLDVVGEIELFARELARLRHEHGYSPPVIGITGTNGKTTTTRLVGLLVERCGRRVAVAGNIGPAALDELTVRLDADELPDVWVLELSSFQLQTTTSLKCDSATVLNVTQDHLDWHGSMSAYVAAKERIFAPTTVRVLNRDDPIVAAMTGRKASVVTFGATVPVEAGAYGLLHDAGMTWLAWAEDTSLPVRRRKAAAEMPAAPAEIHLHRLMPADALRIRGRHNALNALAAVALARAIGLPLAPMLHALREYAGEPHRVQLIGDISGVEFYDDSKGTNVGATVAALEGLGQEGRKLVVILGGEGKGQDFTPLAAPVARHARAAVLIGRDAAAIRSALVSVADSVEIIDAESVADAVHRAVELAQPGDAVILSPACASFDMFRDYRHRAEVFVDAVRELAAEAGQPC
jgi:UDP-N-acetylmuramoylalanine--D-glutamate ligase